MRVGIVVAASAALFLSACGSDDASPTESTAAGGSPEASAPADAATFTLTSSDFEGQGQLPETAKATAFGGQCEGDNISPALAWENAPEGTQSFAITMIDLSSSDFVHWQKINIPTSVTSVSTGGADALEGISGINGNGTFDYFGPCPPDDEHTYLFTIYALDTTIDLPEGFTIGFAKNAFEDHILGQATLAGLASPAK